MVALRSDIEKALDDLISNEEGMRFQGLAVVLAKKRWPDLISCERKKDLGADAIAKAAFAAEGTGKVLACSKSFLRSQPLQWRQRQNPSCARMKLRRI